MFCPGTVFLLNLFYFSALALVKVGIVQKNSVQKVVLSTAIHITRRSTTSGISSMVLATIHWFKMNVMVN
jgi:hypothetical protein